MAGTPAEVVIYIHGVSDALQGQSHEASYRALHDGVAQQNATWPKRYCGVEWGWNHTAGVARSHELLTDAQRVLGSRTCPAVFEADDFTMNLVRQVVNDSRALFLYGLSDMFYYVSEDGKRAVRFAVPEQILKYIRQQKYDGKPLSLTLLGHSAGSVVAFDLLYYLFSGKRRLRDFVTAHKTGIRHCATPKRIQKARSALDALEKMRHAGRLKIRRLFSLGSPITPLAVRSDPVIETLSANQKLEPSHFGLTANPSSIDETLAGPRWLNIWDRDDPIAWPVEPLMGDTAQAVADQYIDLSDLATQAHTAYWANEDVHHMIATTW